MHSECSRSSGIHRKLRIQQKFKNTTEAERKLMNRPRRPRSQSRISQSATLKLIKLGSKFGGIKTFFTSEQSSENLFSTERLLGTMAQAPPTTTMILKSSLMWAARRSTTKSLKWTSWTQRETATGVAGFEHDSVMTPLWLRYDSRYDSRYDRFEWNSLCEMQNSKKRSDSRYDSVMTPLWRFFI